MDSKQASKILERIVAIHKSLQLEAGGSLSTMERDLLLDYLRQLYDFYHAHPTGAVSKAPAATAPIAQAPKPKPVPTPPTPTAPVVTAPAPAPKPVPPKPAPAPQAAPVVKAPQPVAAPAPPAPAPPKPVPTPAPKPTVPSRSNGPMPAKVKALFAESGNNDLSEQLSRQPVKDLTKAMGINDRLLYANDLFQGNQELMNNFLKDCNRHNDFSPAQNSLGELAQQFDWADEEKADTARQFIKLVRRRYA